MAAVKGVPGAELRHDLPGQGWDVSSLSRSPDGRMLASGHAEGTIQVWDLAEGREDCIFTSVNGRGRKLAWSPDGTILASSLSNRLWLWDARTWSTRGPVTVEQPSVASWSPDGAVLAVAGHTGVFTS